jgi:hypothetical protein
MSHFARIDKDGIVQEVLSVEQSVITSGVLGDVFEWVQCSYNTSAGINKNGGWPLRKNSAAVGMVYDKKRDAFIHTKPFTNWVLNEETCQWEAPVPYPGVAEEEGVSASYFSWDDTNAKWVAGNQPT